MDTSHPSDETTSNDFSFRTNGRWNEVDASTMRIHTRARLIQSQQRAARLRRTNNALEELLDAARAQRVVEQEMSRDERLAGLSEEKKEQIDRTALIDLAGSRRPSTEAEILRSPHATIRDLQSKKPACDSFPRKADPTPEELDLRDRSALIDLRRTHEHTLKQQKLTVRSPLKVLRDTQPRSAVADRRWG